MPHILHLLKADSGPSALAVIERQGREPDTELTVVLMPGAPAPPMPAGVTLHRLAEDGSEGSLTYSQLLDLIFQADSTISW
jgi:hypothetical protein